MIKQIQYSQNRICKPEILYFMWVILFTAYNKQLNTIFKFHMGNSQPTSSKLKVHIQTEKPFYNSGSTIQGVVFVDALDNFPIDALYLRVDGEEYCQWFQGSSKNRRKFTGHENFYAVQHMLSKYDKMLQQGKYAYPFSLQLSQNIPGSFSSPQYDARVEYKLIAYFANFNERSKRYYYSVPLMIRQPFRQQECEYQGNVTQHPSTCFCCKKGEVFLEAKFGRNVAFEGESIPIELTCDNTRGKSDIKVFPVELVQYTFVSANNGVSRNYRKVVDRQYVKHLVGKGMKSQKIQHSFVVKSAPRQSAISTLVANYYRLEVYAELGKIASNEPCIYAPLFVMKKQFQNKASPNKFSHIQMKDYNKVAKKQLFKAPQYWFRKNKNLQVMNFRIEDGLTQSQHEPIVHRQ